MVQGHKQSGLVDRRSGYLLAARLPRISAELTKAAMIRLLKPRRGAVQTITLDNGSEFASTKAWLRRYPPRSTFVIPTAQASEGATRTPTA